MIGLYVGNFGKKFVSFKISARSRRDLTEIELHGEISPISARCRKSRCELGEIWETHKYFGEMEEISPQSRRDSETHKHHGEISTNLGEISVISSAISPRSRRDLEFHKHHEEISTSFYNLGEISAISARSQLSRRDGRYLAAIAPRFRIQQTSWRDLARSR